MFHNSQSMHFRFDQSSLEGVVSVDTEIPSTLTSAEVVVTHCAEAEDNGASDASFKRSFVGVKPDQRLVFKYAFRVNDAQRVQLDFLVDGRYRMRFMPRPYRVLNGVAEFRGAIRYVWSFGNKIWKYAQLRSTVKNPGGSAVSSTPADTIRDAIGSLELRINPCDVPEKTRRGRTCQEDKDPSVRLLNVPEDAPFDADLFAKIISKRNMNHTEIKDANKWLESTLIALKPLAVVCLHYRSEDLLAEAGIHLQQLSSELPPLLEQQDLGHESEAPTLDGIRASETDAQASSNPRRNTYGSTEGTNIPSLNPFSRPESSQNIIANAPTSGRATLNEEKQELAQARQDLNNISAELSKNYGDKEKLAQAAAYVGAIIHNNEQQQLQLVSKVYHLDESIKRQEAEERRAVTTDPRLAKKPRVSG